eukprot:50014-Prymnesium_polylepis.1
MASWRLVFTGALPRPSALRWRVRQYSSGGSARVERTREWQGLHKYARRLDVGLTSAPVRTRWPAAVPVLELQLAVDGVGAARRVRPPGGRGRERPVAGPRSKQSVPSQACANKPSRRVYVILSTNCQTVS